MRRHANAWILLLALLFLAGTCWLLRPRPAPEARYAALARERGALVVRDGRVLVDINRADAELLQTLPGIGPALADGILAHRGERGAFASIDSLAEVPGIGPARLDAIRDSVTITPGE